MKVISGEGEAVFTSAITQEKPHQNKKNMVE